MSGRKNYLLIRISQWFLALTLATAAGLKLGGTDPRSMVAALPDWLQMGLIAVELILASWLISGRFARTASFFAIVLLSSFMCATLLELQQPQPRPCGCLGAAILAHTPASTLTSLWVSLGLDVVLLTSALIIFLMSSQRTPAVGSRSPLAARSGVMVGRLVPGSSA
jgi:hypothetical protein